jgi:hypothetical protein
MIEPVGNDANHHVVRHELAGPHVLGSFAPEGCAGLFGFAEHFARRKVRNA